MADIPPKAFLIIGLFVAAASGAVNYSQSEAKSIASIFLGKFSIFLFAGIIILGWGIFSMVAYSEKNLKKEEKRLLAQEKDTKKQAHHAVHQRAQHPHQAQGHHQQAAHAKKDDEVKGTDRIMARAKHMYDEMYATEGGNETGLTPYPIQHEKQHHASPATTHQHQPQQSKPHHAHQTRQRTQRHHQPHTPNFCPNCGSNTAPGARFCMKCGYNF